MHFTANKWPIGILDPVINISNQFPLIRSPVSPATREGR